MKALLLAGGNGERLKPFTNYINKHLLPVAGRPMIQYGLDSLKDCDFSALGVIIGPHGDDLKHYILNNGFPNVTFISQPKPLGIAHAIKISRSYLDNDNFVVYLGDNYFKNGINSLITKFKRGYYDSVISLAKREDPREYGVVETDFNTVTKLVEKPEFTTSHWALAGCYIFNESVHDIVKNLKPSRRGELEISDTLQALLDNNYKIGFTTLEENEWRDMGTIKDIREMEFLIA
jgi:glucose-1-phosphate thymidylyltransferase